MSIAGNRPKVALVKITTLQDALRCVQIAKHFSSAMCGILAADMSANSIARTVGRDSEYMAKCEAEIEKAIKEHS